MNKPVLILDAFGVVYQPADDVADYLVPFVRQHGGTTDAQYIQMEYRKASLGQMTSAEFWQRIGLEPILEDEYLALIPLSSGVHRFLEAIPSYVDSLWCLSNDISEWSRKLRVGHEIVSYFTGFVVSGDVGMRKPDPGIYAALLSQIGRPAGDCVFIDDRVKNLDAAWTLGFSTVLFGKQQENATHACIRSFEELKQYLLSPPQQAQ